MLTAFAESLMCLRLSPNTNEKPSSARNLKCMDHRACGASSSFTRNKTHSLLRTYMM